MLLTLFAAELAGCVVLPAAVLVVLFMLLMSSYSYLPIWFVSGWLLVVEVAAGSCHVAAKERWRRQTSSLKKETV
jgi:hypothetical protein